VTGRSPSVLILGGTGFIGRALISFLLTEGFSVTALVIPSRGQQGRLSDIPGLSFLTTSSSESADLTTALGGKQFDTIINLAAAGVRPDERSARNLYDGNIGFLLNILSAVSKAPPRLFIQTGSWFEYRQTLEPTPITESHSLLTLSIYGSAKAASYIMGTASAYSLRIPFVCLRLFHVYGPGEPQHRLIPYMQQQLIEGKTVNLSSGKQLRDFTYLTDVLEAYKAAILTPTITAHPVYNVCTGTPNTVRKMCETVADTLGAPKSLLKFGAAQNRDDESDWGIGDSTLFQGVTGWRPQIGIQVGVKNTIEALSR